MFTIGQIRQYMRFILCPIIQFITIWILLESVKRFYTAPVRDRARLSGNCAGAIKENGKIMGKENARYKQLITEILVKLDTRRLRMAWLFLTGIAGRQEE